MPRYFTLAEARQYLPVVASAIRDAIDAKTVLEAAEKEHRAMIQRITYAGGAALDHEAAIMARAKRQACSATLQHAFESLEEIGCIVKDVEIGLIDFPALYRGQEVYLCWKLGERDIGFWHPVDEGFAGRRAIDPDFLAACGG